MAAMIPDESDVLTPVPKYHPNIITQFIKYLNLASAAYCGTEILAVPQGGISAQITEEFNLLVY